MRSKLGKKNIRSNLTRMLTSYLSRSARLFLNSNIFFRGISKSLFIKNIAPEVTEEEAREFFSKFGTIISFSFVIQGSYKGRQTSVVTFAHLSSAMAVHDELNESIAFGRRIHVQFPIEKPDRAQKRKQM